MARILTLGSALQDIFLMDRSDLSPTTIGEEAIFGQILVGTKVDIDRLSYEIGGGGVNSAITFKRHGHEVFFAGGVGNDPAGTTILQTLANEKVNTKFVQVFEKTTGTSVILLDQKSGERTILTYRGTSSSFSHLNPNILDKIRPDWLYVTTLHGDYETLSAFFKHAKKLGIKIMFNPGGLELAQKKELLRLLRYTEILLVNKTEAMQIVPGVVLKELLYHLGKIVPVAIITNGPNGGGAIRRISAGKTLAKEKSANPTSRADPPTEKTETYEFALYEDTKVKDATGAGDAFGSGFLASFINGANFKGSLVFASANSTSVVQKIGASRGILSEKVKLHEMPIKRI